MLGSFVAKAADADVQAPRQNESLGAIVAPTAAALAQLEREGTRGPYFLTWFPDAWTIGAEGYGLLNELTRLGFDVKAHPVNRPGSTRYHVMDPGAATTEVHVATGPRHRALAERPPVRAGRPTSIRARPRTGPSSNGSDRA